LFEYTENYENGSSNIYPPAFRIVLYFQSSDTKTSFRRFIRQYQATSPSQMNLRLTDDSNPAKEKYVLCLTPKNASKKRAVDHIIDKVCQTTEAVRSELQVLIAGDSIPDLDMGLRAAKGTKATFLLVGGSRLAHALTCIKKHEEVLEGDFCEMKNCLNARQTKGLSF
jgi:hypothetical protein